MSGLGQLLLEIGGAKLFAYQVKAAKMFNKKLAYSHKSVPIHNKMSNPRAQYICISRQATNSIMQEFIVFIWKFGNIQYGEAKA